jgi:hypothetical protein
MRKSGAYGRFGSNLPLPGRGREGLESAQSRHRRAHRLMAALQYPRCGHSTQPGSAHRACADATLVETDVDRADTTRRADKPGRLIRVMTPAATHLQHGLAGPRIQRLEGLTAPKTRSCHSAMACCRRAISLVKASVLMMPPSLCLLI